MRKRLWVMMMSTSLPAQGPHVVVARKSPLLILPFGVAGHVGRCCLLSWRSVPPAQDNPCDGNDKGVAAILTTDAPSEPRGVASAVAMASEALSPCSH